MGGQQQEQTPAHYNTPPPPYAGPSQYGSSSSSYPRMPAQAYPTALPQAPPAYNPMAPPMYPGASNQQPYYVPSSKAYPAANGAYPAWPMQNPSALPPNVTVVMPEAFDAQARFDCVARPNIPVSLVCLSPLVFCLIFLFFPFSASTTGRRP